jgi:hypothetical protein
MKIWEIEIKEYDILEKEIVYMDETGKKKTMDS